MGRKATERGAAGHEGRLSDEAGDAGGAQERDAEVARVQAQPQQTATLEQSESEPTC